MPSTLASVERAVAELRARHSGMSVSVTVVLDACTDRTAAVVEGQPDLTTVAVAFACVGASRAAGVRAASVGDDPVRTWIANTDADTLVPADWLVVQVELADAGADVVTGTVEPDATGLTPDLLSRWWARHTLAEGHPHVHGANLGVRLHAYESAGGLHCDGCARGRRPPGATGGRWACPRRDGAHSCGHERSSPRPGTRGFRPLPGRTGHRLRGRLRRKTISPASRCWSFRTVRPPSGGPRRSPPRVGAPRSCGSSCRTRSPEDDARSNALARPRSGDPGDN